MALKAGTKPKANEPTEEQKADADEEQPAAAETKTKAGMVKVYNPQIWGYVQPGTGIQVPSKKVTEVKDDGWLANQLKAGVLQKK